MNTGLKRFMAFILSMTLISVSALNMFLGKYALTFALTDSLSVTFESEAPEALVNLPPGREMNTLFNPATRKIVFGATVADLPNSARLINPAVMSGYTMVAGTGQTNPVLTYVSGVSPATFDPTDNATYGAYRVNDVSDGLGLFAFYDVASATTYFVSSVGGVTYHFNEENAADPLDHSSTDEYNDFFYGLADLTDIVIEAGSSWDTSDVQTFHNFFKGCESIRDAELAQILSWIDFSSAYSLSEMFSGMTDIITVNLSNTNLSNAGGLDISYMLSDMTDLTSVYFPTGANQISLLSGDGIKGLFSGDTAIEHIDISDLPYGASTNDTDAFKNCSSLQMIIVASDFVHSTVEPAETIFEGCDVLVGQAGTSFADEYALDSTAAVGKSFAYVDGKVVDGVPHDGYYTDKATVFTITFDANGGTSGSVTSITESVGTNVVLPAEAETTHTEDAFIGWALLSTARDIDYETGDTVLLLSDMTLYAVYEVTVYVDMGANVQTLINSNVKHIVYCLETEVPDLENQTFVGNADYGGAGEIKVYYDSRTSTTYFASTVEADHVVFQFNADSQDLYYNKTKLETISHTASSRIDTSRVTTFRDMFKKCVKLEENSLNAFISEFDTSSAVQFNAMFSEVSAEYLDISSFDTSNVTDFSWMFEKMSNLKEINFGPGWDVSKANNVTITSGKTRCGFHAMFTDCTSLEEIDLSGWELNTNSFVDATDMFKNCSSLTTIYTDDTFDWTRLDSRTTSTKIGCADMFTGCTSLVGGNGTVYDAGNVIRTYAKLDEDGSPGYFTGASQNTKKRITFDANGGTSGLRDHVMADLNDTVTITADYTPIANTGYEFAGWGLSSGGVVAYEVGDTLTVTDNLTLYAIYEAEHEITSATLATGAAVAALIDADTTDIVFGKRSDLPAGATFKGNADAAGTGAIKAYYKNGITYFIIDSDEHNVTIIFNANCESMFLSKASVETISHTQGVAIDTSNVTNFRQMFARCSSLDEISLNNFISEFDTSSATSLSAMFSRTNVETVDISNFVTSGVTNFSYMFDWMPNLKTVVFGSGWDVSKADNSDPTNNRCGLAKMFDHSTAIEEIDLSGWTLRTDGYVNATKMFCNCTSLKTIYSDGSFDASRIDSSKGDMFNVEAGAVLIIEGGDGTVWDSTHVSRTYARIDDVANGTPGYFTYKAPSRRMMMLAPVSPREMQIAQLYEVLSNLSEEDAEKLYELYPDLDIEALDELSDEDLAILAELFMPEKDELSELREILENLSEKDTERLYGMYPDLDLDALDQLSDEDIEIIRAEFAPAEPARDAKGLAPAEEKKEEEQKEEKGEAKEQKEEEKKEDIKEETKEEKKEDIKEETKEEKKEDIKEEVKENKGSEVSSGEEKGETQEENADTKAEDKKDEEDKTSAAVKETENNTEDNTEENTEENTTEEENIEENTEENTTEENIEENTEENTIEEENTIQQEESGETVNGEEDIPEEIEIPEETSENTGQPLYSAEGYMEDTEENAGEPEDDDNEEAGGTDTPASLPTPQESSGGQSESSPSGGGDGGDGGGSGSGGSSGDGGDPEPDPVPSGNSEE